MNLILDSVRSFSYERPFSKIVSFARERKAPRNRGIAESQSAVLMNSHGTTQAEFNFGCWSGGGFHRHVKLNAVAFNMNGYGKSELC